MDELSEKLSSLLSDPSGMEKIKAMAQSLMSGEEQTAPEPAPDIDPVALTRILGMLKSSGGDDHRIRLLKALKPNLSPERQPRVDKAIKILKLLELAPLLKEAGITEL